jgi:two-component system sensor histidine kinase KdpD
METERARSLLLSSVSHDLRTPLTAITGAATSLSEGASKLSETARRELAATIAEESHRLNRLIGNILEMTRLESGALRLQREWNTLEDVVGSALVRLEPCLDDHPVRVEISPDLPLVWIDDVLFEQVVWNLVENAVKYTPAGGPIDLEASVQDSVLVLRVRDQGPGLAPDERDRVFEKFYRGKNAVGRPGAGLGLAICRGIVQAHGGTVQVETAEGGGALFVVRVPMNGAPPVVEREALAESMGTSLG